MTSSTDSPITVYYDGACPVCRREIGFYRARTGGAVEYCDVATAACPAPDLSREDALQRFHVRLGDGTLVSGAGAFLALWREMGWLPPSPDGIAMCQGSGDYSH